MRLSHVAAMLVLLPALALAGDDPNKTKFEEPEGLLQVKGIGIYSINDRISFSGGRRYGISINEHVSDAKARRAKFAKDLKEQKQLDQVVFDWFGKQPPKRLNIEIGSKVPVQIAQAAITAYGLESKIPVFIKRCTDDESLGRTQSIVVGGLVDIDAEALKPEQLRALVKPGLTQEQFVRLLSKKRD